MQTRIAITGGAGYIGSHLVKRMLRAGHAVLVLDNLSTGHRDAVGEASFAEIDVADRPRVEELLRRHGTQVVMHLAGSAVHGEATVDPAKYYGNNVGSTLGLLQACVNAGVRDFIYSSSAAVYGEPQAAQVREEHACRPVNAYGRSKLMAEQVIEDHCRTFGLRSVAFRYFNAAGADPEGELGERHQPETHLIPLALEAASGARPQLTLFGTDYATADGTCVRDYVHVADICEAHLLGLKYLQGTTAGAVHKLNLGNGNGYSVRAVIAAVERITGARVPVEYGPRRAQDPAMLVADSSLARHTLGWRPRYADIEQIIAHAWAWHTRPVPKAAPLSEMSPAF